MEFNDNGSGFIFAAMINALYCEAAGLEQEKQIAAPDQVAAFKRRIGDLPWGNLPCGNLPWGNRNTEQAYS
jgi:hypothetical protein